MAQTFKTPADVASEYLLFLKGLQPTINIDQQDSDWWIRSQVVGGVVSGVYADQLLISNDAFPQKARHDAIGRFLDLYLQRDFLAATQAQGLAAVTGTNGMTVPQNLQMGYAPNGNVYLSIASQVLPGTTGLIAVKSVAAGQNQNLLDGALLNITSPPAGLLPTAVVSGGILDGKDPESDAQARAAVLLRIRSGLSVGRVTDYIQYAMQADPSVTSASVVRFPFGLGTVAVYITSGTTDIDTALNSGLPISIIPSGALITTVQNYLNVNSPETDCVSVFGPTQLAIDVTVKVRYAQGIGSTILSGQTLTQDQLVIREVKRALYKTPVGGRQLGTPASGYVVCSEIEQTIDLMLSASPVTSGTLPVLLERQVANLAASGSDLMILGYQAPIPGTITLVSF